MTRSYWKSLDAQGGEKPAVDAAQLKTADFVTFGEGVEGANCGNCAFNDGGVCSHPGIEGQPVNDRNCCSFWDAEGTLRAWEETVSGGE